MKHESTAVSIVWITAAVLAILGVFFAPEADWNSPRPLVIGLPVEPVDPACARPFQGTCVIHTTYPLSTPTWKPRPAYPTSN